MQILRENNKPISELPLPRYAHQVVYNANTRSLYLHGGNSGGLNYMNVASRMSGGSGSQGGSHGSASGSGDTEGDVEPERVTLTTHRESNAPLGTEKRLDDFWRMELRR